MEKQIISGHLSTQEKEELENQIYESVKDSLRYSGLSITWHKMASFEVFCDGVEDGTGIIELGCCRYKVTEENKCDFVEAFEEAREKACSEYREEHKLNPMNWMAPFIGGMGG